MALGRGMVPGLAASFGVTLATVLLGCGASSDPFLQCMSASARYGVFLLVLLAGCIGAGWVGVLAARHTKIVWLGWSIGTIGVATVLAATTIAGLLWPSIRS